MERNTLFPVFLKIEELHTLLVGGGNVGFEKLNAILANAPDAKVTVVAPTIRQEVKELAAKHNNILLIEQPYSDDHLQNKSLVICATDNADLHKKIKLKANSLGLLVNVADTPPLCDFYLGSIVQKGNLKIAISTNGKSPTVAKRVKEVLNESIPSEINDLLDNVNVLRDRLKGDFQFKIKKLNELTQSLVEEKPSVGGYLKKNWYYFVIVFLLMIIVWISARLCDG
jgi:siroheme synthase-like protein